MKQKNIGISTIITVLGTGFLSVLCISCFNEYPVEEAILAEERIAKLVRDPRDPLKRKIDSILVVLNDPFKVIDSIIDEMDFGNISFNTPQLLEIFEWSIIHLTLGVEKSIDTLKSLIKAEGEKVGARIRISPRMEARLSGHNFQITAITPEVQAVSRNGITEWKWEIIPTTDGELYLHLTLSALIDVEGTCTPRTIRTFKRIINVEIPVSLKLEAFFWNNWKWLWAAILVPVLGWIWRKRKKSKKVDNEDDKS